MTTPVIFRKFRKGGDVIALFPTLVADMNPALCQSYMHVGQHGAAAPGKELVPAAPEEYANLLAELRRIGYDDLKIVRRFTQAHFRAREAAITNMRSATQ